MKQRASSRCFQGQPGFLPHLSLPSLAARCLVAASVLLPLSVLNPRSAVAAPQFALACLGTETGYTINFSYRWGNGRWTSSSVAPGKWKMFTYKYKTPGVNRSPVLSVRYDDNTTDRSNVVVTDLDAYAASIKDCEAEGKTYNFYQRDTELYIQEED